MGPIAGSWEISFYQSSIERGSNGRILLFFPGEHRVPRGRRKDVRAEEGAGGGVAAGGGAEGGQTETGNSGEYLSLGHNMLGS